MSLSYPVNVLIRLKDKLTGNEAFSIDRVPVSCYGHTAFQACNTDYASIHRVDASYRDCRRKGEKQCMIQKLINN